MRIDLRWTMLAAVVAIVLVPRLMQAALLRFTGTVVRSEPGNARR